ncbi:MAG: sulfatase-like hydrolase/transferase [Planctomycetaceae bacterium]
MTESIAHRTGGQCADTPGLKRISAATAVSGSTQQRNLMMRLNSLPGLVLSSLLLSLLTCAAEARAAQASPNMLVILADDLGYADLACCGSRDMKTPHLDRLFSQGMKFSNFYANCPVCSPTRAALLTGRYQEFVGVPGVIRTHAEDNWGYLDPAAVLLPKIAQSAGYHTAIVGKWHLGLESPNTPTERGFDLFRGFRGDMMDDYYNHRRHAINYMFHNETEVDPEGHATDLFTNWAVEYLADRKGTEQPFLLYLAYNAPHTPIQPPKDWEQRVLDRESGIDPQRAKLVALIEHMDDGIGQVLKALHDNGHSQNTIIVFTSDNGGQLGVGANNGPLRRQTIHVRRRIESADGRRLAGNDQARLRNRLRSDVDGHSADAVRRREYFHQPRNRRPQFSADADSSGPAPTKKPVVLYSPRRRTAIRRQDDRRGDRTSLETAAEFSLRTAGTVPPGG